MDVRQGWAAAGTPDQAAVGKDAAVFEADAIGMDCRDRCVEVQADLPPFQGRGRALTVERRTVGKDPVSHLDQVDPGCSFKHVRQLASQLHPRWSRSDNRHGGVLRSTFLQVFDKGPQALDIIEIPKAAGMLADTGNPKIIQLGPRCQHQITPINAVTSGGGELVVVQIDPADAVLQPADAAAAEQLSIGGCHLPALQLTAQQLIEKWLKQETVTGLNHHHRSLRQAFVHRQSTEQAGESPACHHHGFR